MAQAPATTSIRQEFEERFAGSLALHRRSRTVIPGGITHDGRHLKPFPPYVARTDGARKWDVDGHELLDYVVGHGALILGHNEPSVTEAVRAQLGNGTHYGAGHEGEIRWAEAVAGLVPSAELVKFTSSGTEATLLAVRLARAFTGRPTLLKFEGHFHGWNDYAVKGEKPPFDDPGSPGIPPAVMGTVAVLPADDPGAVEARLAVGDVAAIIVEPSGGSWGTIPLADGFLARLRELATAHGTVLIFDEVITGFRWSPGGAQARLGVMPDLTTLAKIVAGGLPGGAVAGSAAVMERLEFKDEPGWNATRKVRHPGTFNANPLSAAAGVACLARCADPALQAGCDSLAARLRAGMNATLSRRGLPGFAWGESSAFHVSLGENCANRTAGDLRAPTGIAAATLKKSGETPLAVQLHLGMLLEGVELFHGGGFLSAAHTDEDVDETLDAFDRVLERMDDGIFGSPS
ncbi:MAG: aminotransferase, Class III pyridoxal-phosphate dependent [uncultured Thermomicrobiales bacterium]|uniref:Aminotransferase, Class III pyridoxal-phosphate dependent n=1 Tax=uncultured Thermomicrobiales bacterium TaxID=1645740 RepID=A0A6J4VH53_9BACT|nr:MAG: aminotransferase, Class III pyridoxal-phosphate dependent [uncultured Thermomicrobiales bacterium]